MTKKVYRTAQGKTVDLGALQLQNENVRAVGNMNVNARGDIIDGRNRSIESRNRQVSRQYNRQVTNVNDDQVIESRRKSRPAQQTAPVSVPEPASVSQQAPTESAAEESTGGLAAAIARARQLKQEPVKTFRELVQQSQGVTKI